MTDPQFVSATIAGTGENCSEVQLKNLWFLSRTIIKERMNS
jgi:hypothetical protein